MLFTIAIPTYNNASVVSKAIDSAINQDYKEDYEVLIVNNASTDNTVEVLETYKSNPKVRIISNEKTVDQFQNHNVCFREAKGDYVVFIHSDDELCPYALSVYAERIMMRRYPPRYILWGHSMFRDYYDSLKAVGQRLNEVFGGAPSLRCFVNAAGLTPSGTCYSRESILRIGGFPEMKTKSTPLDCYILFWAAFNKFEFEMIDRMVFLRMDASTAVRSQSRTQILEDMKDMFDILFAKLDENQKCSLLSCIINYGSFYLVRLFKNNYSWKQRIKAGLRNLNQTILR